MTFFVILRTKKKVKEIILKKSLILENYTYSFVNNKVTNKLKINCLVQL